jgi:hypothetical protein
MVDQNNKYNEARIDEGMASPMVFDARKSSPPISESRRVSTTETPSHREAGTARMGRRQNLAFASHLRSWKFQTGTEYLSYVTSSCPTLLLGS